MHSQTRASPNFVVWAGVVGASGVALGAFGAHGLRQVLSLESLATWHTGVEYQLWHAAALLALGLYGQATARSVTVAASLMLVGIALFSGSLYALAVTGFRPLGFVTPFGGLCLLGSWLMIAWSLRR